MLCLASLLLPLLFMLPRVLSHEADESEPTPSNHTLPVSEHRLLLVISLSGLNADDLDLFSMPNLMHLRSHASYPSVFMPQYPGTGAPNLYSMATGLYPEVHGVLADKVYDPKRGKILTERDQGYFTQNPMTIPIWNLNEYHRGVSACLMWPGCEVPVAGHRPTFHVPRNDSASFTDLVDLIISFASAKFTEEDYEKYVAGRASEPADVVKSAMVKNNKVDTMEKARHGNGTDSRAGDVDRKHPAENSVVNMTHKGVANAAEHEGEKSSDGKTMPDDEQVGKKTVNEKMLPDDEQVGKKTVDEKMVQTNEQVVEKNVNEKMRQSNEQVGKNLVDEKMVQTNEQVVEKNVNEKMMPTNEQVGKNTVDEKMMQTNEQVGKNTVDEKMMQADEHVAKKMSDEKMMQPDEHVAKKMMQAEERVSEKMSDETKKMSAENDNVKGMKPVEHAEQKTGNKKDLTEGIEYIDNKIGGAVEVAQNMEYNKNKSNDDVAQGVEYSNDDSGGDEILQGMEHISNDSTKRSPRDLRVLNKREKRSPSWIHRYFYPDPKYHYSSETEEKYEVVSVVTEDANDKIKQIINAHQRNEENDKNGFHSFEEAANRSSTGNQDSTWHPYPFFKNLARTRVMYTLEERARANLVMARFNEPARTARRFGPHSPQMMAALHTLDSGLLYLHLQLQKHHLHHTTNVILVSDHGSTVLGFKPSKRKYSKRPASDRSRAEPNKDPSYFKQFSINLDSILDPTLYVVSGETPLLHIWPKSGKRDEVYALLKNASSKNHFTVYDSKRMSYNSYHFSNNPRIAKILLEADPGYVFSDKATDLALAGPWKRNTSEGMPLLLAAGPSFKENYEGFSMEAVDLYPLMMEVLNIHDGPPNNGSFMLPSFLLINLSTDIYHASWAFAVMAVVILVLMAVLISCCCRHGKRTPASPAPQRMSDIYRNTVVPQESFMQYEVQVDQLSSRSRSASADCVDGGRTAITTPARTSRGKKAPAPAIPCRVGEEVVEADETDERTQLLHKKAATENIK